MGSFASKKVNAKLTVKAGFVLITAGRSSDGYIFFANSGGRSKNVTISMLIPVWKGVCCTAFFTLQRNGSRSGNGRSKNVFGNII